MLELVKDIAIVLPAIYLAFMVLRLLLIAVSVRFANWLGVGDVHISWQARHCVWLKQSNDVIALLGFF